MPTIHIKIKLGDAEVEIKADGELDKETINAIKSILAPVTSRIANNQEAKSTPTEEFTDEPAKPTINIYAKFKELIPEVFKYGQWFTSIDAKEAFYDTYGIPIKTSTASTYLRRMEKEGLLTSRRDGRVVRYRVVIPAYAIIPKKEEVLSELYE